MALNFTVSYTFSPSTTISSSQVNTNTTDVASVFQGLEAETKTLAKLKVDIDPTLALEVATKQYVDHYSTWRRPVLQYGSATTVAVESGLNGTSGNIAILFPDGTVRTETSTTRTTFDITRNTVLVTSGAQSGLRGVLSEAANTTYSLYAVKVTDSSTLWCTVGDTLSPTQTNYASLNTNFGTSGWVYLGAIRNGDGSSHTTDILNFVMSGNTTYFINDVTAAHAENNELGYQLADTGGATSLAYTVSRGTGAAKIPDQVGHVYYMWAHNASTGTVINANYQTTGANIIQAVKTSGQAYTNTLWGPANAGISIAINVSSNIGIYCAGWTDNVLGVGSNPIL